MFGKSLFLCISLLIAESSFAVGGGDIGAVIEINGVVVGGGLVYVSVYSNENDYKSETSSIKFILEPADSKITHHLKLPEGEYAVSVFQDSNNDEKLNTNIIGTPIEPIGKTNYNLKGAPGGFNVLKTPVNGSSTKLIVNMGTVRAF